MGKFGKFVAERNSQRHKGNPNNSLDRSEGPLPRVGEARKESQGIRSGKGENRRPLNYSG